MAIIRAIISVQESRDPGFTYYLRSGGNGVVVVASATAGGNSICVAQLPPDIRCQQSLRCFNPLNTQVL